MKTIYPLLLCLMTAISISCQKNEYKPNRETGNLHVDIGLEMRINEVSSGLKSMLQTENFKVIIYNADGTEAK